MLMDPNSWLEDVSDFTCFHFLQLNRVLPVNFILPMQDFLDAFLDLLLLFLTFEHETQLLKRPVVRFGKKEIDGGDLYTNPDTVEYIIFPSDIFHRNRIDISIEEISEAHGELLGRNTLRTLLEGKDFDHVCVGQCIPSNVVEPAKVSLYFLFYNI